MTEYNTGNPVGSADPRDLYDTAIVADNLVQGTEAAYPDRLGVSRKSWAGIEAEAAAFFESSGYEFVGDYAAGIELTRYSQVVRDTSGEFFRLSGSTALPYTTTGAGLPEGGAFVAVGDAVLRQELAASTTGQGSDLISHTGTTDTITEALDKRTIYVGSVAESLSGLQVIGGQAYRANKWADESDKGEIPLTGNTSRAKSDHNGITVFSPTVPPVSEQSGTTYSERRDNYLAGAGETDPTGTGVFVRSYWGPNGLDFYWAGAVGDGAADDDGAVLAVWNLMLARGYPIDFSDGTFKKSSTLTANQSITVRGQSKSGSIIDHTGVGDNLVIDGGTTFLLNGTLSDFTLKGDADKTAHTGTTGNGLVLSYVGNGWSFENLDVLQNKRGLSASNSFTCSFRNCRFQWNREVGAYGFTEFNNPTFDSCMFNFNGLQGARLSCVQGSLYGCNAEGNEEEQVILLGRSWYIGGTYFEKPKRGFAMLKLDGVQGCEIGGGTYFNDLGFSGTGDIIAVQIAGASSKVELGYGSLFRDTSLELIAVDIVSGSDNAFWLREVDVFRNASSASNKRLDPIRVPFQRKGMANVADGDLIPHGLGETPGYNNLTVSNGGPLICHPRAVDATNITVGLWTIAGDPVASARVVSWEVGK